MVKKEIKEKADKNTEERILAAAKKVLFSKGYAGARMQDIADEAGINKALLHYYFRSKDKLFEMIFKEAIGKLMPQISSIFNDSAISFYDKIRAFCSSYISTWMEHPYIPMFVLHELHSDSGRGFLRQLEETRFKPVKDVLSSIEMAVKKKEIRRVDPHHLFLNMISLCLFPFMGSPVFKKVTGITDKQFSVMMQQRADEVSEFIIESIKYRK
jgi:TetR/AcrR family transcriptional regulator